MTISRLRALGLSTLLVLGGCADGLPTTNDEGLIPVDAETLEVLLPFDLFATDFGVFAGFGSQADLPGALIAHEYEGELDSNGLIRFGALPAFITVPPPQGGPAQIDSAFVPVSGVVTLFFDSLSVRGPVPIELELSATETPWDLRTASWTHAADTLGGPVEWPEAGGGDARVLWTGEWSGTPGDSLIVEVDSLTVSEWADTSRADRGLRIRTTTAGSRVRMSFAQLQVNVATEVNPDTLVAVLAQGIQTTFIYTPEPALSTSAFQIGGAPSRRATFRIELPATLQGDAAICQRIQCPFALTADRLLYAGLELTTHGVEPRAFQPLDTLTFDIRPVLSPDRLPRSPLGSPVQALGRRIGPEAFVPGGGQVVEIPMTRYVRDVMNRSEPGATPTPNTISILSLVEPTTFEFASFFGPGTSSPPRLRLILTLSEGLTLP